MDSRKLSLGLSTLSMSAVALAVSQAVSAGTAPYFIPLTHSEGVTVANSIDEVNAPFEAPAGISQTNLTSLLEVELDIMQSIQRIGMDGSLPAGGSASMFDMLAFDPTGRYIFIPHETPVGAGVTRYDRETDTAHLLFAGDQQGAGPDGARDTGDDDWTNDFGAFDPARWTPNGTVIAAEEWAGRGRVVEIMNPMASPVDPTAGGSELVEGVDYRILNSIASVSHEGINFSQKRPNDVIYFIDEDRSGSIYKLDLKTPGDYMGGGQTFVLKSQAFIDAGGDVTEEYRNAPNTNPGVLSSRFGWATWEPITDADGNPLTEANPFDPPPLGCGAEDAADECRAEEIRPGRTAADEVGGVPFGRPEDMTIGTSAAGNEMLYFTATSEHSVISIEETPRGPYVRLFATADGAADESGFGTPKNLGFEPTSAVLQDPDNLATDALGNVFIIEDAPNSSGTGGDVWFARDTNGDGVAESIDHFLSIQVQGSESTGMIFHPTDPTKFVIAVQHPTSTGLADDAMTDDAPDAGVAADGLRDIDLEGNPVQDFGDAIWEFDLLNVAPPECPSSVYRRHRQLGAEDPGYGAGLRDDDFVTFDRATHQPVRACSQRNDSNAVRSLQQAERGGFPNP